MQYEKLKNIFHKIREDRNHILSSEMDLQHGISLKESFINSSLQKNIENLKQEDQTRIMNELNGFGPLQSLLEDDSITEILINQHDQIYFEHNGNLLKHTDCFFDRESYLLFIERLCQLCRTYINYDKPFIEHQLGLLRITAIFPELSRGEYIVSIRKQPKSFWTLDKLFSTSWATADELETLKNIITQRKNFIVVGGTGSGKTSFLQSAIHQIATTDQRLLIIEDTQELHPIAERSTSLLTRHDSTGKTPNITMNDLIKKALRLRPDRICVGEIRGDEATALLMALATGHDGSFGSIHARTAHEALLRLEMLIQMGAPQWSLHSIRRLIGLTIQNIIVVEKKDGKRKLQGIYEISSVEEHGVTLQQV